MNFKKIIFNIAVTFCLLNLSHVALSQNHDGSGAITVLSQGEWIIVPITNTDGTIENVMILKGISKVNIPKLKVDSLRIKNEILSEKGYTFADGSKQTTAQLKGEKGERGRRGDKGDKGDKGGKGDPGPSGALSNSVAVCQAGTSVSCSCSGRTISRVFGACSVTSDTGPCANSTPNGCCAVCAP